MAKQDIFTDSKSQIPFTVRVVLKGDSYGLDDCLEHDGDEPLVEFYDRRYMHVEDRGQFTGGRYYASTLLKSYNQGAGPEYGLCLHGDVDDWAISRRTYAFVLDFINDVVEGNE